MSVLIKDMKMPTEGELLCINIYPDGKVCINLDLDCKQVATAVPVPTHGRLGDLDELYSHLERWYQTHKRAFSESEAIIIRAMLAGVKETPTIIEAEEATN